MRPLRAHPESTPNREEPLGVDIGESARILEHHVGGPLGLIGGPVVVHRRVCEDLAVKRIQRTGDGVEFPRPVRLELPIHPTLGEGRVAEPGEAVVGACEVGPALAFELVSQPLAPVHADLDGEGEPGLDPCAHESEARMNGVLVEVKTLAVPEPETAFGGALRSVVLESATRFDCRENADEALLHGMFREESSSERLLVDLG